MFCKFKLNTYKIQIKPVQGLCFKVNLDLKEKLLKIKYMLYKKWLKCLK